MHAVLKDESRLKGSADPNNTIKLKKCITLASSSEHSCCMNIHVLPDSNSPVETVDCKSCKYVGKGQSTKVHAGKVLSYQKHKTAI